MSRGKSGGEKTIRALVWLILLGEIAVAADLVPVPGNTISPSWLGYLFVNYLVFYELPLYLARRDPQARGYVFVVGLFVINALVFDLIGNLFNLWEVPLVGAVTYDNLVHATSMPFAMGALAWALARMIQDAHRLQSVPYFVPVFVTMGGLSLAVLHELVELAIDVVTGSNAGTSIAPGDVYDTSLDLAYDVAGIALFVVGLAVRGENRRRTKAGDSSLDHRAEPQ